MRLADFSNNIFNGKNRFKAKEFSEIGSIENFCTALERERNRTDRSGMPFALISFEAKNGSLDGEYSDYLATAICTRMRTTDKVGWIDHNHIGLILYNSGREEALCLVEDIQKAHSDKVPIPDCGIYIYPPDSQDSGVSEENGPGNRVGDVPPSKTNSTKKPAKYMKRTGGNSVNLYPQSSSILSDDCQVPVYDMQCLFVNKIPAWKRLLDIFGATFGLIILSPVFLFISCLIQIVSPGPIFFRQERLGCGCKEFQLLKFRTMRVNTNHGIHQHYYSGLINGDENADKPMAKLDDQNPQIIPFGKILRKTYLDELPQLINVLRGEMSLVGPRPPIPYEVAEYMRWHEGRFDIISGMTGLWQVSGKNNLTFKEMVRLDIRYSRNLSFIFDMKILLRTPFVIISELLNRKSKESFNGKGVERNA